MKSAWIVLLALGLAAGAVAQEPRPTVAPDTMDRAAVEKSIVATKIAVASGLTTGAPYSAEAVNEANQTLADGNRITQKSVTRVYRDGEGRTRRDDLNDNGEVVGSTIVDPVAHTSYVLDPKTRTAYRGPLMMTAPVMRKRQSGAPLETSGDKQALVAEVRGRLEKKLGDVRERSAEDTPPPPPPPPPPPSSVPPPPPPPPPPGYRGDLMKSASEPGKEDLGRQTIEGVAAAGTRVTWTVPAGAIGNLQPIRIVSEQWFSPDLQVLVLTKHTDPRTGENIYRLQNIVRAEPDRSLFSVPSDYTIKEAGIRKE